jgi:hypothetical protein
MREGAEFFKELGQILSKEGGLILIRAPGFKRCSLRREYLGKEQAA